MNKASFASGAVAFGLGLAALPAAAAIIVSTPNADIATTPYTISFEPGETLTFSDVSASTTVTAATIGVQTTGSAEVFSVGGQPAFFQPFATTLFPSQQGGSFAAYASPTGVPYSLAKGLVGFEYALSDGIHYGVAEIGGSTVTMYRLDTTPGESFSLSVPEPATWATLLVGAGLTGWALRRRRSAPMALTAT